MTDCIHRRRESRVGLTCSGANRASGGVTKRSIMINGSLVLLMIVRLYLRKFLGLRI